MRLKSSAELRRSPSNGSASFGRLPEGSILTFEGQSQRGFMEISVELEDGSIKKGWVNEDQIESSDDVPLESLRKPDKPLDVKKKRMEVPEDEQLLIKRESSFFYGIHAGAQYSMMQTEKSQLLYTGVGFMGGAQIGTYLGKNFPARFEVTFSQENGEGEDLVSLSFNFLKTAAMVGYQVRSFELSLGFQYIFGMGISDLPRSVSATLVDATDLNSPGMVAAMGYRFSTGGPVEWTVRLRYDLSFLQTPFTFQNVALTVALDLGG